MTGHRTVRIACIALLLVAAAFITGGTSALATGDVTITVNQVGSPVASAGAEGDFSLALSATNNTAADINDTATLTLPLPAGVTPDASANCTGGGPYVCPITLALLANESGVSLPSIAVHADPSSAGTSAGLTGSGVTDTTSQNIDVPGYTITVAGQAGPRHRAHRRTRKYRCRRHGVHCQGDRHQLRAAFGQRERLDGIRDAAVVRPRLRHRAR